MIFFRRIVFHVLLPLLAGGILYMVLRPETWIGSRSTIFTIRFFGSSDNLLLKFVKYNLPDFCWSYSLASALFLWSMWATVRSKLFPFFVFALVVLAEIIQLFLAPYFTFDWIDAGAAVLAFLLSYRINL